MSNHARPLIPRRGAQQAKRELDLGGHGSIPGTMDPASPAPRPHLALIPAMLVALGMILSTDVLKTAPTVALHVAPGQFVWLWVAGGLASAVGALCYVEMACAFPDAGGEYHFLTRAWGPRMGALYALSLIHI